MIGENISNAFLSLRSSKLRSFLTMLGIIIGVAQIIVLIGLGQGIKKDITSEITQLGSNVLIVLSGKVQTSQGGFNPGASVGASTLTESDFSELKKLPDIIDATRIGLLSAVPTADGKQADGAMIMAVDPSFFQYTNTYQIVTGRFFNETESQQNEKVIVIGNYTRELLFPGVDPAAVIGRTVMISKQNFTIVGVFEMAQQSSFFGNSSTQIGVVIVPYSTAKSVNPNTQIFRIGLKANDSADVKVVSRVVQEKLNELHGTNDTSVFTQEDLLKVVDNILGLITKAIVGLASISLLVGGIGIMNIMLVAVMERTREIGLRKAVGATGGNIMLQFLTESIVLSLFGGAIGVGLATVASVVVKKQFDLTIIVDTQSVIIAMGFALAVGVIFGLAPAAKAALKNPIEALRYE
ncbi:MAG: ABC transporter permease [Patescibacteria group bacterium]